MIDINITLLFQFINFVIALIGLNYLLIQPVRKIVAERRRIASGLLHETESFNAAAALKLSSYEAALAKARDEAAAAREAQKEEALLREAGIMEKAQLDAHELILSSRENTREAIAEAMADMRGRIPALARMAAAKLLGAAGTQNMAR